jgi:DNA (cytosine-5)-methyltransferase 1
MRDSRTHSLHGLLDLVDSFLPQMLLLENVAGFLRGPSSARPLLEHGLAVVNERHGTAYELQHKILDAVDYGVPQRRQRAIAVAIRSGRTFGWPEATHTHAPARCWDAIGALQEPGVPSPTGRWAGLLPSIPEGHNYQWHTDRGGGEPLFGYRTRYWSFLLKLARDQPSWTLPASPGPSTGPFHWDNRPLTTTERLRLQSFPASWFVPGDRQAPTRLVGNATPPLLAEVIGRAIAAQLDDAELPPNPTLAIQRVALVPPPVPPAPVPSAYMHMRGRHAAHPGTGLGPAPRRPRAGPSALPPPQP